MTAAAAAPAIVERPILFKGRLVRAILAGAKTQTRRAVNLAVFGPAGIDGWDWGHRTRSGDWRVYTTEQLLASKCPYGAPGDRLWVRETHAQFAVGNRTGDAPLCVAYRATCDDDGGFDYVHNGDEVMRLKVTKWTPAIHMPRWASRIDLAVAAIRVERLQSITEEDARAEGCSPVESQDGIERSATEVFADNWREINGAASWDANPWVWVVSFRRVRP